MLGFFRSCFRPRSSSDRASPWKPAGELELEAAPQPRAAAGPPAGLRIAPELVLRILDWVVAHESGVEPCRASLATLPSVCLVSRWFYQVAFPLLYRAVVLPTMAEIDLFVRTVRSEAWRRRLAMGELSGVCHALTVSQDVPAGGEVAFDRRGLSFKLPIVLRGLPRNIVRSFTVQHLPLALSTLQNLSGLESFTLRATLILSDLSDLSLPNLTTLTLEAIEITEFLPGDYPANVCSILRASVLPNLTALTVDAVLAGDSHIDTVYDPGFTALLGQLESLTLGSSSVWTLRDPARFFAALAKLERLAIFSPDGLVQTALRHIPARLQTLDLSGPEVTEVYANRRDTPAEFGGGLASVGRLEVLALPSKARWSENPNACKPAAWLRQAEAWARARGVKVEFK